MIDAHPSDPTGGTRSTSGKATLALMFGLLAAPLAFLFDLGARFGLVEFSCRHNSLPLWIVLTVAVAVAGGGGLRAWRSWQHLNETPPEQAPLDRHPPQSTGHTLSDAFRTDEGGPHGRSRFLALAGIAASGFFLAVILASVIPSLLIGPCT